MRSEYENPPQALTALLRMLGQTAQSDWERARDRVNFDFEKAGRWCSGRHINHLSQAASLAVFTQLERAIAVAQPKRDFVEVSRFCQTLFDEFISEVIVLGMAFGGERGAETLALAMREKAAAWDGLHGRLELWRYAAELDSAYHEIKKRDLGQADTSRGTSYKTGRPPSKDEIIAKAREMRARGMSTRQIAKDMRQETGFENAGNVLVREVIDGIFPRGRPRKQDCK